MSHANPEQQAIAWARSENERGTDPHALLGLLLEAGWSQEKGARVLEIALSGHSSVQELPFSNGNLFGASPSNNGSRPSKFANLDARPIIKGDGSITGVDVGDRVARVRLLVKSPRVVVVENLLSDEECDELIKRSQRSLSRSATVDNDTGVDRVISARTSEGTFFRRFGDLPLVDIIDRRLANLSGSTVERGEDLQILHYHVGGEYRPHHDYFDPKLKGSATHLSRGGQRTDSIVMYLNTPEGGGGTAFPRLGIEVPAKRGTAVWFQYGPDEKGDVDPRCLHAGLPVKGGEKWIATKWIRERSFS